jgi:hypothetical protein
MGIVIVAIVVTLLSLLSYNILVQVPYPSHPSSLCAGVVSE